MRPDFNEANSMEHGDECRTNRTNLSLATVGVL